MLFQICGGTCVQRCFEMNGPTDRYHLLIQMNPMGTSAKASSPFGYFELLLQFTYYSLTFSFSIICTD